MDITTIAQQSPFVVVCVAFLWVLKQQADANKDMRNEHAKQSDQMIQVVSDNTTAMNAVKTAIDVLSSRVDRLEK